MKLTPTQQSYNNLNKAIDQLELSFADQLNSIIDNVDRILLDPKSYDIKHSDKEIAAVHKVYKTIFNSYYSDDAISVYCCDAFDEALRFVYLGSYKGNTGFKSLYSDGSLSSTIKDTAKDEILSNIGILQYMSDMTFFTENEMSFTDMLPARQALASSRNKKTTSITDADWTEFTQAS